jgi:hypothetical protein
LASNTTGVANTATGANALRDNNIGINNSAFGSGALAANTSGSCNTAVGCGALRLNQTGANNTATGFFALCANTTGINNTATGANALAANQTGTNNTAIGFGSLQANQTGSFNVAIGRCSLASNTTGLSNTAIGVNALLVNTTGSANIMIGGQNSVGGYTPVFDPTVENDRVVMGSTTVTNAYVQVAWTVVSDARDKIVEGDVPHGLEFVKQLEPKAFHFKEDRESDKPHGPLRYGFLAQEILALEGEEGVIIDNEDPEKLRYNGEALVPVLVNAIKEIASNLEAVTASNEALAAENADLKARVEVLEGGASA